MASNKLVQTGQRIRGLQDNISQTSRYVSRNLQQAEQSIDKLGLFYKYLLEFKLYKEISSAFINLNFYPYFGPLLATKYVDENHVYHLVGGDGSSGGGTGYVQPLPTIIPSDEVVWGNTSIKVLTSTATKQDFLDAISYTWGDFLHTDNPAYYYDTIELVSGTYSWTDMHINVDRATMPLTIKVQDGYTPVIFDGGGTSQPLFTFGDTSYCSFIQFLGPWEIQNFKANPAIITTKYVEAIGMWSATVKDWEGVAGVQDSHALLISSDGVHRAKNLYFGSFTIEAPLGMSANGFAIKDTPSVDSLQIQQWKIYGCTIGGILNGNGTDILITAGYIKDCGNSFMAYEDAEGFIESTGANNSGYMLTVDTNMVVDSSCWGLFP